MYGALNAKCPRGIATLANFGAMPSFFSQVSRTVENATIDETVVNPIIAQGRSFLTRTIGETFSRRQI